MKVLPFVAYRWADGPWVNCFCQFGWDPRKVPKESADLQVITFCDPYFQNNTEGMLSDTMEFKFKKPPTFSTQYYQIQDIEHGFVAELVRKSARTTECDTKLGWL